MRSLRNRLTRLERLLKPAGGVAVLDIAHGITDAEIDELLSRWRAGEAIGGVLHDVEPAARGRADVVLLMRFAAANLNVPIARPTTPA